LNRRVPCRDLIERVDGPGQALPMNMESGPSTAPEFPLAVGQALG
jgi:hypothetical protein